MERDVQLPAVEVARMRKLRATTGRPASPLASPGADPDMREEPGAPSRLWSGALVLLFTLVALFLRLFLPRDAVLVDGWVRFRGTDPWYHMRLIDYLVENFPDALTYDPYLRFPGGQDVPVAPFFDLLAAGAALLVGRGAPDPPQVELVAAALPAVLGAGVVVAVYLLGRALGGRLAGLFAAALAAVLPGAFLQRTLLGAVDHHAAEIAFSTAAAACLVVGLGRRRRAAALWTAAAGAALAAYLLSWGGGGLFLAVLGGWAGVDLILRGPAPVRRGPLVADRVVAAAALALLLALPLMEHAPVRRNVLALGVVLAVLGVGRLAVLLVRTSRLSSPWKMAATAALGTVAVAAIFLAAPTVLGTFGADMGRLSPSAPWMPVSEAVPLLQSKSAYPWLLVDQFGLAFWAALLALPALWAGMRARRPVPVLVAVWLVAMFGATLGQVRFAYYLALPVVLLAGLACVRALERAGRYRVYAYPALLVVLLAPSLHLVRAQGSETMGPSATWVEALEWMRASTPEPLGSSAAYLADYGRASEEAPYDYPPSAYGVMAWWDPGYWIIRIGRRIPHTNPTQTRAEDAARFFTSTAPAAALRILDRTGSRYVVVSGDLPLRQRPGRAETVGYFRAMVEVAELDAERFWEIVHYRDDEGALQPLLLYHPAYYRSASTRLFAFDGEAVAAGRTFLAWYRDADDESGIPMKLLEDLKAFDSHEKALAHLAADTAHPGVEGRVVGVDPSVSPIPVQAIAGLRRVYPEEVGPRIWGERPWVQIYERAATPAWPRSSPGSPSGSAPW